MSYISTKIKVDFMPIHFSNSQLMENLQGIEIIGSLVKKKEEGCSRELTEDIVFSFFFTIFCLLVTNTKWTLKFEMYSLRK